jgi:hypothetical protein
MDLKVFSKIKVTLLEVAGVSILDKCSRLSYYHLPPGKLTIIGWWVGNKNF